MNKTKKILSFLTALTISASTFTGMIVPSNAEELPLIKTEAAEDELLAETFEGGEYIIDFTENSLQASAKGSVTVFDVTTAEAAGAAALNAAGANNVLKLGSSANGASKYLGYTSLLRSENDNAVVHSGNVSLSFKIEPIQIRTDKDAAIIVQFADINKTPILPITVGSGSSAYFTINGKQTSAEYGKYYIIKEDFDFENKKATIEITDADGTSLDKQENLAIDAGDLTYMYFADQDWLYGNCAIDDITIQADNAEAPVYYTATVNTERYAKFEVVDGKTYYADVNGKIEIPLIKPNTTINYKISKVGYVDKEGSFVVENADVNVEEKVSLDKDEKYKDYLYIESDFGNESGSYVSTAGSRSDELQLGTIELDSLTELKMKLNFDKLNNESGSQKTLVINTDGGEVGGLQWTADGLSAWTGWTGNAAHNQSSDCGAYKEGELLAESANGKIEVSFVIDKDNKIMNVLYGNKSVPLKFENEITKITSLKFGLYRNDGKLEVLEVSAVKPDEKLMFLAGDTQVARVKGKTVTREYTKSEVVVTPDETFEWKIVGPNEPTSEPTTEPTSEPTPEPTVYEYNDGKLTVNYNGTESNAKIIVASYKDKALDKVDLLDNIEFADGKGTVDVSLKDGAKVMIWDSLDNPKPLLPAYTYNSDTAELAEEESGSAETVGVSVTSDGVVSIDDTAIPGNYLLTATGSTGKSASLNIDIEDFANVTPVVDGPEAYEVDMNGTYKVTSLIDEYGDNVIDLFAPSYSSDNTDVITVDAETGAASVVAEGNANITVKIGNEGKESEIEIPIIVGSFYVTTDATGASTEVSLADIVQNEKIISYQVTTATEDGVLVKSANVAKEDVVDNKITVDTTDAAKVEVAPVYSVAMNEKIKVPADRYNVTVTATNAARSDVYANNQMMFNNINQGGDNWVTYLRTIRAEQDYTAEDVCINEGYAEFKYMDDKSGGSLIKKVIFVKAPSIVARAKRVYVIGDSLVANYHGDAKQGEEGFVRTGWGQVLQDYISGARVTNLGNSGAWATGMVGDAFTNVLGSAQEGDIVIWESGYNDRSHSTKDEMKAALQTVVDKCSEKNLKLFFVTPNASVHDYTESVVWSGDVRSFATDNNVDLIDLSKMSYDFLKEKYGTEDIAKKLIPTYNNAPIENGVVNAGTGDKGLHSTYNAANCWAAIIAGGLYADETTRDIVDTEFTYQFNDGTNDITVQVNTEQKNGDLTATETPAE